MDGLYRKSVSYASFFDAEKAFNEAIVTVESRHGGPDQTIIIRFPESKRMYKHVHEQSYIADENRWVNSKTFREIMEDNVRAGKNLDK